jgi:hypothetical protein
VVVTLSERCDVSRARSLPPNARGMSRFEQSRSGSRLSVSRFDVFPGGCTKYDIDFDQGAPRALLSDVERALAYTARTRLMRHVDSEQGLVLCGRGAACPG